MVSRVYTAGLRGIEGFLVTVECSSSMRLPRFEIVGLPDAAVKEAKERVRAACENSGYRFPTQDIVINLAPADWKKEGAGFDLAIVTALLQCDGRIPRKRSLDDCCFLGELSLSGTLRPVRGLLPLALAARAAGKTRLFVPDANAEEAAVVEGVTVYRIETLTELVQYLCGETELTPLAFAGHAIPSSAKEHRLDFQDVRGQYRAKRAMEIAAAGGHNILLIGPPGSGKSMLAKRLPTILPDLSFEEALESSCIHSVAGVLSQGLLTERPFRAPHHSISLPGLVGGGANPRPGEISLSHNGVLFLDELPEFPKNITEALRAPLEEGNVLVTRAAARMTFPARFMLVCAMNPCRCGYYGAPGHTCTCREEDVRRYLGRVSGPLLDRIDIQIELPAVPYEEMSRGGGDGDSSACIRARVNAARAFAAQRQTEEGTFACNAALCAADVRRYCRPDAAGEALLSSAFQTMGLSGRGYDRILRVARTIADLAGAEQIGAPHLAEAIQLRSLDKYWHR